MLFQIFAADTKTLSSFTATSIITRPHRLIDFVKIQLKVCALAGFHRRQRSNCQVTESLDPWWSE